LFLLGRDGSGREYTTGEEVVERWGGELPESRKGTEFTAGSAEEPWRKRRGFRGSGAV
jgi:hypothetical protein